MSDLRCPRCGAVRRHGDQWCGLCYADFREPPPVVVGDVTQAPPPPPPPQGAATPAPAADGLNPPLIRPPDQPGAGPRHAAPQPVAPDPPQAAGPIPAQAAGSFPAQAAGSFVPSTNPLAPAAPPPAPLAAGTPAAPAEGTPAASAVDGDAEEKPTATWPCPRCELLVPIEEDSCPACGAGFLDSISSGGSVSVPLIGDVRHITSGQKLLLGVGIATGILLGLVVLFTIGGVLFS